MTNNLDQQIDDKSLREYAYNFDFLMHEYFIRTFSRYGLSGRALELGAHKGDFTQKLLPFFDSIVAVEGASKVAGELSERFDNGKVQVIESYFESLTFDSEFDAIFLMHTLEHIEDSIALLKNIKRWLSPNGKFFLACPNANAASRQIAVQMELIDFNSAVTEGESVHGHYKTYSLDTLQNEARKSGLKIDDQGGIFFKPLANFQLDKAMEQGVIDRSFLDGCYALGNKYPDLCSSIYLVCSK